MTARLTPPLKWHGGKNYLAVKITALLPPHRNYVEPYAGGLAVLLAKDPDGVSEVANDLDGRLANFWRCLADEETFAAFQKRVAALPFGEFAYRWAAGALEEWVRGGWHCQRPSVVGAAAFFVACRQSLAGRMKGFAALTKNRLRRGMNEQVSAWLSAVDGLPEVHARLRRVLVLNRDALNVIREFDTPATAYYLDPPYLHDTRATTADYAFEMTTAQHGELLDVLAGLKGKFVLSGYHHPLYDDQARRCGWRVREFELPNNAAGGKSKRRMTECLWLNYEPQ
jgi:DNA adenine methylase